MISESLITRTRSIIEANPTIDVMDALKQAIQEENAFMMEMIEQKTERAKKALVTARETTYVLLRAKSRHNER